MHRFREILVYVTPGDDAPELVARAGLLAERNGARLTLIDVVPMLNRRHAVVEHSGASIDLQAMVHETRLRQLNDLAELVPGAETRVVVMSGNPFHAVVQRVMEFDHDLLIAAPDRSGSSRGLRGATTAMHLLRKCPCPVWIDDPAARRQRDVLVALGPLPESGEIDPLNQTLLELGTSLASTQGGAVHIVHAWQLAGEHLMRNGRVRLSADEVDRMVSQERELAEVLFKRAIDGVRRGDQVIHEHLLEGEAADVISAVAAGVEPGVVVMGTLARAGLPGLLIGNTAERLLDVVEASVLAVKPPGFESPVKAALATAGQRGVTSNAHK